MTVKHLGDSANNRKREKASCPLCDTTQGLEILPAANGKAYFSCSQCYLAFLHPDHYLTREQERSFYATHNNSIEDLGYVQYLQQLTTPLLTLLPRQNRHQLHALDYGCGPGPTLHTLLENEGIRCDNFDPLFADHPITPPYDIITATECFEHFHRPADELEKITGLLNEQGFLAVMTNRWKDPAQFFNWHYTRDPTHVVFMHDKTIAFIAKRFRLAPVWQDEKRVVIFQRSN
ncbi:MAG: methyltransferase domain-containing protein [Oleibacter sp.]|nr:methyltransferase domain-containing protein [Thalassolituus sp.]